jgi:putative redox protein
MSQQQVKDALLNTIKNIQANPSRSSVVFRANTHLEENVRCSVKIRNFDPITIDEPPELAGANAGVNPVELVLAALGTCQEIMYSAYASVMDIPLHGVSVNVKGYLDLKGLFGLDESVPAGYQKITFETEINSPADDETLRQLIDTVESHCPVLDILCSQQKITGIAKVKGRQIHSLQSKAA